MQRPGVSKRQEAERLTPNPKNTKFFKDLYQISMNLIQLILYATSKINGVLGFWVKPPLPLTCY
jgi:hypothetical protein